MQPSFQLKQQTLSSYTGELEAERELFLRYANSSSADRVVLSGSNDFGILSNLRSSVVQLKSDYFSSFGSTMMETETKTEMERRFMLLEHEIDGLLRRRI